MHSKDHGEDKISWISISEKNNSMINEAKLNAIIFVGPQIREIVEDIGY